MIMTPEKRITGLCVTLALVAGVGLGPLACGSLAGGSPEGPPPGEGVTPLMRAADAADLREVERLLAEGDEPRARDEHGRTALMHLLRSDVYHHSVMYRPGKVPVAEALLAAGTPIDSQDTSGATALVYAVRWNHFEVAALLLRRGADVTPRDRLGRSALTWAASRGADDEKLVRPLLRAGATVSLLDALLLDDLEQARGLVSRDVVRHEGPGGETALMLAARAGDLGLVRRLLAAGADPRAADASGRPVLLYALGGQPLHWVDLGGTTWEAYAPAEPVDGRVPLLLALLAAGAPVDAPTERGETALAWAVRLEAREVARLLLERGADPNAADLAGQTPLTHAIKGADVALVRLLLEGGADPSGGDSYYSLPLVAAVSRKQPRPEVIRVLLEAGARVNDSRHGRTPLMAASHEGTAAAVAVLLEAGADVNARSRAERSPEQDTLLRERGVELPAEGLTALMLAAGWNTPDVVRLLLEAGADVHACSDAGETALDIAMRHERQKNAALLRQAGSAGKPNTGRPRR
jgi:ankyrin repeat protein